MEAFAFQLEDEFLRTKLQFALDNRKPFANFNHIIHQSKYRQSWFDFRLKQTEQYIWQEMEYEIEKFENRNNTDDEMTLALKSINK